MVHGDLIDNLARNQFLFIPDSRTTKFGSVSTVKQLEMAFEGQEIDNYLSTTNGLSLIYKPKENLKIQNLWHPYMTIRSMRILTYSQTTV
jgi:hypothetical protein